MRKLEYLSPSSIATWTKDKAGFYLRYLSDNPLPKEPQNHHMVVGSSFDAFVKNFLHTKLFGEGTDPKFDLVTLFNDQVENESLRRMAWDAGIHLFENYKRLGALDNLLVQLGKTIGKPRFEMDVRGSASCGRLGVHQGIPIRVKPDLFFVNEFDAHVILDWKVNGFWTASGATPLKGYVRLREDGKFPQGHAEAVVKEHKGIFINTKLNIENQNEDWARQLFWYSVMCGEEVGADFIAMIHQLVCKPGPLPEKPRVRVAEHACFISREFQDKCFREAADLWEAVSSDWIFRDVSKEESQARCALLDQRAATIADDDPEFARLARG
jgi:hypothetical protein